MSSWGHGGISVKACKAAYRDVLYNILVVVSVFLRPIPRRRRCTPTLTILVDICRN
jgi:hypothetical protein